MPVLSTLDLLLSPTRSHDTAWTESAKRQQPQSNSSLRSKSSFADLFRFARNPFESTSEIFEDWLDGSTKAERTERQAIEAKKQLLYLKLQNVRIGANILHLL